MITLAYTIFSEDEDGRLFFFSPEKLKDKAKSSSLRLDRHRDAPITRQKGREKRAGSKQKGKKLSASLKQALCFSLSPLLLCLQALLLCPP